MSAFQGAVNTTINGGNITAVSNTGGNHSASNDIVDILHSRSATAGLLDAAERFDAPKCDEGTRVSMLRAMKNFVQQGGLPSVFWLHGPAGVGKSALAQSLALSLKDEGDHAASFFFSRTAPGRNDGNQLIITLACQLALSIPAIKPLLAKVIAENRFILNATNTIKMQRLIVDPINRLHKMSRWSPRLLAGRIVKRKLHPRLILVDGLDECNDPEVQRDLILCIGLAVQQLSLPFQFIIASRPESHILATFELDPIFQGPDGVKVSMMNLRDDEDANGQITIFLLKEFAEIRRTHPIREFLPKQWPLPGQIAQLVSKSSKGFIYPATVIRYIKMPKNRPDECLERILGLLEIPILDKPYEPLDILYRHIFESIPDVNKEAVRGIFHFLIVPNNLEGLIDITPRVIEKYFNYKPGHVQHVLYDLLCVVTVASIDHPIEVLHASLPDFLLDRSRSGPLCIDIGDAHAAIAGTFPLVLSAIDTPYLPDFGFAGFLEHMMQSNLLNTPVYHQLVDVDFRSQYEMFADIWFAQSSQSYRFLPDNLESIAFLAAYLLALVIKNVEQMDIRGHITGIKAYILQKSPFASSLHEVAYELAPGMIPVFREWVSSTIDHNYINYIFTFEVPPSQCAIREEIFELYLLMMSPFLGFTAGDRNYFHNIDHQPYAQQLANYSIYISLTLLDFSLRRHGWNPSIQKLQHLAADLLGVSLAHAGYSTSLTTLLHFLLDGKQKFGWRMRQRLRKLAPIITDYAQRVYLDASAGCREEILELDDASRRYGKTKEPVLL